jgi:ActR/RegA family two-component response regulator
MPRVLLIDEDGGHAEQLGRKLAERGLTVIRAAGSGAAIAQLRNRESVCDLVILCMTDRSRPWLEILRNLQHARLQSGFAELPLFLCVSRLPLGIDVQLQIERAGARYASEE